ncbi:amidohydrolase family protein [Microbacterium esteraromaticum]|uniref:Amidohydrolase family protein n=1 Tax=Microbacterium esteraromaticum TaxID=57043 RepID=A0A7D7WCY5_9MICO|nr:amidohydrolase family protein [Microbacterium esteraromaticum]QMU96899.1 amidohydrolase family protein [Microbacterium esteraromaticum]
MPDLTSLHHRKTLLRPERILLPAGPVRDHAVLVENGVIADVGPVEQFVAWQGPTVDLPGRMIIPGFIDAHHHVTQTFGKALVFGEPSEIFRRVWVPMESHMDADAIDVATRLAAWESLRGGFTTVADAGTRATGDLAVVADAVSSMGLRCVLGAICNDLQGDTRIPLDRIEAGAREHLARWDDDDLIHPSLAISIPEAATDDALVAVAQLSREAGVPLQMHVNEHLAAIERSLVATGKRPMERLASIGALGPELLAAHATMLTPREIRLLRDAGGAISYNPVASSWKGNAVAPALLMHELGVRMGLGTDGTRSDAFRLLDAAETAQRLTHALATGDSSAGGGWTWLETGLQGGADAVGLAGRVGVIAPGAYADLLVLDLRVPELVPSWDPMWELVRLGNRDLIESVIVHGRLRVQKGQLVDADGDALLDRARETAERVVRSSPIVTVDARAAEHRAAEHRAARTGARA